MSRTDSPGWLGIVRRLGRLARRVARRGRAPEARSGERPPRYHVGERARLRMASTAPVGDLALVAMVRNEGPFLAEWLTFHRRIGFQRIYLYDNGSDDETFDVVAPFVRDGLVDLIDWPLTFVDDTREGATPTQNQKIAYLHALERSGHLWRWMAFLDADEFLFPAQEPDLPTLLRDFADLPALVAFWRMFGTSGLTEIPPAPMLERLTKMAPFPTHTNTKPIVQPRHVRSIASVNAFDMDHGAKSAFDEHRRPYRAGIGVTTWSPADPGSATADRLLLNHYVARSTEDLERKLSHLDDAGRGRRALKRRRFVAEIDAVAREDLAIQRFVPGLRADLAAMR